MTTTEPTITDDTAVACPFCLVPVGAGCRTINRRPVPGGIHKARRRLAADERAIAAAARTSSSGEAVEGPAGEASPSSRSPEALQVIGCTGTIEAEGLVHEGDRCPVHEDENGRPLRPTFTPGEAVEILQFTDDLYSWDRAWQPATYVSRHGGSEAHIVQTFSREIAVWPSGIRKATR